MRLPQGSSKITPVMGPMLVGSPRNLTPSAFRRRRHGQPTELTHGYVFVLHKAQCGSVKAEGVLLIVHHYAGEPDLHGSLLMDMVRRGLRKRHDISTEFSDSDLTAAPGTLPPLILSRAS